MIKAIFFDLDDTLLWDEKSVKEAFKATCKFAAGRYGIDPDKLEQAVREEARNLYSSYEFYSFSQMIGINPFEGLWGDFGDKYDEFKKMKETTPNYRKDTWSRGLKALGIDDEKFGYELGERFPEERRRLPFLFDDTIRILDALKGNYQLLLLTNGSPELQKNKLEISPELVPYFDYILISGDFGKGKPDPSIFEHALSLMKLEKNEVIMVGDNLMTDILGANRAGIKSVWVNRQGKPRKEGTPTYEITQLEELLTILEKKNIGGEN